MNSENILAEEGIGWEDPGVRATSSETVAEIPRRR